MNDLKSNGAFKKDCFYKNKDFKSKKIKLKI